ncbi:hypothetical protein Ndes2526B_g01227 [Nannochloris sp. 'desiccata']
MSVPAWYETYLLLHRANVHPFSEPASIPFLSDVWNVNSIFITPHSDEEPPSLSTFSYLLPSVWDTAIGQAAPPIPRAPFTPEEIQASLLASSNTDQIPSYISAVPHQSASASFEASSPLKSCGVAQHQQENVSTQIGEGEDFEKKTRRIASKLHIMASKKQLNPAKISDDEARALIDLQLKTTVPLLPPWYRHAPRQALQLLQDGCNKRFDVIQETAKEQSAGVGEADMRRMKRQFSSLKNTFLHYVVKDEFIAALADGLPNGTEEIQLAQFEEEGNKTIERLRTLKAQNGETQNEINGIIAEITAMLQEIQQINASAASTMARLQEDINAAVAADAAMPPAVPEGINEAECHAALAEEEAQACALEAQIAAQLTQIYELEAVLPIEREATGVARAELTDLEEQRAARSGEASSAQTCSRFASTSAWSEENVALLQNLGGVKVLSSTMNTQSARDDNGDEVTSSTLELGLSTAYPTTAVSAGSSLESCSHGTHTLTLTMDSSSFIVTGAVLSPPDIDTSDIVDAAVAGARKAEFVVREVRSRLAGVLHRRALAQEVQERFPGTTVDAAFVSVSVPTLQFNSGGCGNIAVQLAVEQSWPAGYDVIRVVSISGNDSIGPDKAQKASAVRVEGQGIAAAVDALVAVLNAAESI